MFFLLIFPTICLVIVSWLTARVFIEAVRRSRQSEPKFSTRQPLLSTPELVAYRRLRDSSPEGLVVCPKVCVWDVIQCDNLSEFYEVGEVERLKSTHIDFVLMDIATGRVVCAIDLRMEKIEETHSKGRTEVISGALAFGGVLYIRMAEDEPFDIASLVTASQVAA